MTEEAPLCICGKPRILSKYYRQDLGSYYYATCGNLACRSKAKRRPITVGKKMKFRLGALNNPHKICDRPGCGKEVGGELHVYPRSCCSNECRMIVKKQQISDGIRRSAIKTDYRRKFFSKVYADLKGGATKTEIRRKYRLDANSVVMVIDRAITNRRREITNKLHSMDKKDI